ncbi:hypothetical protein VPH35_015704 [Triticum aestivum]
MASGGSGGTDGRGGAWPTSLGTPDTDELIRLGLMVPPGCHLPHIFHITADGYPTRGPGATPEEFRRHEGGRWNIAKVVAQARRDSETGGPSSAPRRSCRPPPAATPSPSSSRRPVPTLAGPAAPPAVEIPPEQFALREDGDPDDYPGYLIALWVSRAEAAVVEAREAAELQAALDAAAAMAAAAEAAELQAALDAAAATGVVQAPAQAAPVEDDAVDWDDAGKSSNDDDGDGSAGEIVDLAASDDDE